ncbi:hypothetical protein SUGI_0846510 [Cryptomeria japonica]|nr:uncharacterized protein LOC131079541 isoform X2 [Cryptomeria japonica]GLJ40918.1 hypothetical protein SUGI_0846510 [Cryptomeria japonica]
MPFVLDGAKISKSVPENVNILAIEINSSTPRGPSAQLASATAPTWTTIPFTVVSEDIKEASSISKIKESERATDIKLDVESRRLYAC